MRRASWAAPVIAVVLSGCAGADGEAGAEGGPEAAPGRWQEPARYSFTLDSRCGEQALIGRFQITVDNGKVSQVTGLDEQARGALKGGRHEFVPTLRELLDQVDRARSSGADVATASFDPADGHPTELEIDPELNTVDDESCYVVSDYRPTA
jgi:Family of unknown function (DUF6174)